MRGTSLIVDAPRKRCTRGAGPPPSPFARIALQISRHECAAIGLPPGHCTEVTALSARKGAATPTETTLAWGQLDGFLGRQAAVQQLSTNEHGLEGARS